MSKLKFKKIAPAAPMTPAAAPREGRGAVMIRLMQAEAGATAKELADAVGWQVHSVRGFIAGSLKKRTDLALVTSRTDGTTRYRVTTAAGGQGR